MKAYGAHALTLDHLGGLIGQFLGGDPAKAPQAPQFASPEHDRQALRLARLLKAYEEHLPPPELALLCRLCLLERSVQVDQIVPLFLCSPAVHFRTAGELVSQIALIPVAEHILARPAAGGKRLGPRRCHRSARRIADRRTGASLPG